MTNKPVKKVSLRYAKKQFSTVGLVLMVYILLVSYLPRFLVMFLETNTANSLPALFSNIDAVLINGYEVVGIAYACVLLGTILPFSVLKSAFKIRFRDIWRRSRFKFFDLLVYGIVIIALGSLATYSMSILNTYIPIGTDFYIGIVMDVTSYTSTPLFAVLFCLALPVAEEVALRGILLRALGVYGNLFATYTTAFLYAALQPSFGAMIPAFLLALFLTNMTLRFRSITPAIITHIIFNSFIYGFQFIPVSYYTYVTVAIFALYILAFLLILSNDYKYVHIPKRSDHGLVVSLFFTRITVILSICLSVGLIILSNF